MIETESAAKRVTYRPELAGFRALAEGPVNLIPVYRLLPADLETPVTVYLKLMDLPGASFLLESVEGGEQVGRFSFVGVRPRGAVVLDGGVVHFPTAAGEQIRSLAAGEDVLHVLKAELERFAPARLPGLPRLVGGAVGYLGYDVVRSFERLPETAAPGPAIPEAIFLLTDTLVVFDHARHQLMVLANAALTGPDDDVEMAYVAAIERIEQVVERLLRPLPAIPQRQWLPNDNGRPAALSPNHTPEHFEAMVAQAKEHIAAGDVFQVVLSQRLRRPTGVHPFAIYRALRMLNPSPYMFYFDFRDHGFQVVGSSPEMHVRLEEGLASLRPIAGTRPRGASESEDAGLEADLLADEKERAEHVMLVDLARNDLGRVSDYGSVRLRDFMRVERYSHVMHIVSHVEGRLRPGVDAFDLLRATFPAGTVSGAPKVRAMELIETLEGERRGLYAGAVGYFSHDGSMDTCIAIRTMIVQDATVIIQAGAGIVADSDPAREHAECLNKARALAEAVAQAESGLI